MGEVGIPPSPNWRGVGESNHGFWSSRGVAVLLLAPQLSYCVGGRELCLSKWKVTRGSTSSLMGYAAGMCLVQGLLPSLQTLLAVGNVAEFTLIVRSVCLNLMLGQKNGYDHLWP